MSDPLYAQFVEVGRKFLGGTLPEEWTREEWEKARLFMASCILEGEREARRWGMK